jgi:hypothetical protein
MKGRRSDVSNLLRIIAFVLVAVGSIAPCATGQSIYVKVVVDEEEAMSPTGWQERLGRRVESASDVISRYCGLRFAAASYDTWDSDDSVQDLNKSLRELEQEVSAEPEHIAVAFSSQYHFGRGRNSAGGTRGPLHSHILIREGAQRVYEPERVEVLVHELGHFLGAAHSASPVSAMRPTLGDGLARSQRFQIQFDPENAQVIRLVAAEIRDLRVRRFEQLSPKTKRQLRVHYGSLIQQNPGDPTARKYVELIDRSLRRSPE